MKTQINDTPADVQKVLITGYQSMTPREKMRRVSELNKAVQQLALARIRKQYGEISEREQRLRLAGLWLNRETMIRVFDWDPEKEGY
jgi:hypothetical protein